MTVDRPRDLEPCPERPEHHFLLYPQDRRHKRTHLSHTHVHMHAHINTNILWAAGDVSPWATGIDVFWHIGLSSVNYSAATLAPSASKMNEPTYMPGNNSSEAGV